MVCRTGPFSRSTAQHWGTKTFAKKACTSRARHCPYTFAQISLSYPATTAPGPREVVGRGRCMFGLSKREEPEEMETGPSVSKKLCTGSYNGKYPTVGLYDCKTRKVWVCKPLSG